MRTSRFALIASIAMLVACGKTAQEETTASGLVPSKFITTIDNIKPTRLYTIRNAAGMEVCVTNIGGRIVSILVPDNKGELRDVVLGFDNIEDYKPKNTNFGAIIGRYGNRIGGAKMTLKNTATYKLRANDPSSNPKNTLHGGVDGFHTKYFNIEQTDSATLICRYFSKNMEEGFPGDYIATVTYSLTDDNSLQIDYEAETNVPTVSNMTNHSYFNLSGDPSKTILDHTLYVNADAYTPTDVELIPTGKIDPVAGTPLDFTTPEVIGKRINDTTFEAIRFGNGYDHNYVLNRPGNIKTLAAKLVCPETGIGMEVYTTEPGIQVYSGNFLDGTNVGKKGIAYAQRTAICLETQKFPNSPNIRSFPNSEIYPDTVYTTKTVYKFVIEK